MEFTEHKVLQHLETCSVRIGKHSVSFVDTTNAWSTLLRSICSSDENDKKKDVDADDLESNLQNDASEVSVDDIKEYNILPEYARYNHYYVAKHERVCTFCRKEVDITEPIGRLTCRVCDNYFHEECVRKRGYCDDEVSRTAVSESRTSVVGWSCPRCEDIFNLLAEEEKEEIIDLFEEVSGEDKVIDIDEFICQKKEEYRKLVDVEMTVAREKQERELFDAIDQDNSGYIDRWEFLPYMAIRYISRRKASQIIAMLKPREVSNFREFFRDMDTTSRGKIGQWDARQAYVNWYKSKVKACKENYVDYTWYGGPKENTILMALKLNMSNETKVESEVVITWEQYFKICALHVISARINTVTSRPKIPPMPIYLYSQSACLCYLEEEQG